MRSRTKNEPRGALRARTGNRRWIFAALAALAIVAAGVGAWTMRSAADSPAATTNATTERPTLDPARFFGVVHEAYEVAQKNPALLAQLHCYCGCDKVEGHRNLLDCFRDRHGSRCEICVGEAIQARHMADQGATVEQIRDAVRARYYHEG